ncbi:MAG: DUF3458 domain-containing protein [Proteobacteria bacterium]|nr:DUF3458 domain-containing protein [Pseudomonadota bacterium]
MTEKIKKTFRLDDYALPPFITDHVELKFFKHQDGTYSLNQNSIWKRTESGAGHARIEFNLVNPHFDKDGNRTGKPFLLRIEKDGEDLSADGGGYSYDEDTGIITIPLDPDEVSPAFSFHTFIDPENNPDMQGLYRSGNIDMTQFESDGFVRMTPFPGLRPDILPRFTVRAEAPQSDPTLLSNGNLTASGNLENGRHWVVYENPIPGPNYIVAFAAGEFDMIEDTFVTRSGETVHIPLYAEEKGMAAHGIFAIDALKKMMKYDEDNFDAEYDLDNFKILAVSKFKFGAMENKGFEISQDTFVLVHPETGTYDNIYGVYNVVGHEGFHNRSGNRTTIQSFMHVGQKEGLTTLRQQMFMEYLSSPVTERIDQIQLLRRKQFPNDDTPLARPILPDEVDNIELCYDGVAYEKSAEIKRMMATMMGWDTFKRGVAHYFKKHDLQAASMQDFVAAIEDVSGLDLSGQFFQWYKQSGHPHVSAKGVYDADAKTYTLTLEQKTPPTPDQPIKQPMFIPVKMALVDKWGKDIPVALDRSVNREMPTEHVLNFTEERQSFTFIGVKTEPAYHSVFRDFSAPVSLDESGLTDSQLYAQMRTDPNGVNRWEAAQTLCLKEMKRLYNAWNPAQPPVVDSRLIYGLQVMIADPAADPMFLSQILALPGASELEAIVDKPIRADVVSAVAAHLKKGIGQGLCRSMDVAFNRIHDSIVREHKTYSYDLHGKSNLKRSILIYMMAADVENGMRKASSLYNSGDKMDRMMALQAATAFDGPERDVMVQEYFDRYAGMDMELRKWLAMTASENSDKVFEKIEKATQLPSFDWHNAKHPFILYANLAANYTQFHRPDGKGYETVADGVIRMEKIRVGGSLAARLLQSMANWRDYGVPNRDLMLAQLHRVKQQPGLSDEVVSTLKSLLPADGQGTVKQNPGFAPG